MYVSYLPFVADYPFSNSVAEKVCIRVCSVPISDRISLLKNFTLGRTEMIDIFLLTVGHEIYSHYRHRQSVINRLCVCLCVHESDRRSDLFRGMACASNTPPHGKWQAWGLGITRGCKLGTRGAVAHHNANKSHTLTSTSARLLPSGQEVCRKSRRTTTWTKATSRSCWKLHIDLQMKMITDGTNGFSVYHASFGTLASHRIVFSVHLGCL